ncbi:hypothetical protein CLU79DRAFT_724077 [Phycomyces nitens]|nr:hypothetical protein CLU79DRAFT_724077 [Phycomyces nitens]
MPNPDILSNVDKRSGTWNGVNASLHNHPPGPLVRPNKVLPLFTSPGSEALLSQDAVAAAWARTINPTSVVFHIGKIASDDEFCELMSQDLIVEVLFPKPETRRKAITDGLTIKGSRIVASPGFSSDANIVKVNLYDIPACQVEIDLCDPLKTDMAPYGKVIHVRAYVDRHGQFEGKLLCSWTSSAPQAQPLQPRIHIGGCFNTPMMARSKAMPPHCRYCRQEGHLISACPTRPPRCRRCGETGHLANETLCPDHPSHAARKETAALKRAAEMAAAEETRDKANEPVSSDTSADSTSPNTPPTILIPSPQQDEDIVIPEAEDVSITPAATYTTKVIT